jgi:hypothetical protein
VIATVDSLRLIDWDAWRLDLGAEDLAYMMALHWYPERRRRVEMPLLRRYHEALTSHGVSGYGFEFTLGGLPALRHLAARRARLAKLGEARPLGVVEPSRANSAGVRRPPVRGAPRVGAGAIAGHQRDTSAGGLTRARWRRSIRPQVSTAARNIDR